MAKKKNNKIKYLIGVDEVGRGPLAGPVTIGIVLMPVGFKIKKRERLTDSKKLKEIEREDWFSFIKSEKELFYKTASVSAVTIDESGITRAIKIAITRALFSLERNFKIEQSECEVLLDGLLHAPLKYKNQKTIIKGDEKIPVISLASIAAKVTRDRKMKNFAKKWGEYGFDRHKGYGTKEHYKNIKKYGMCELHRRSYLSRVLSQVEK